MDLTQAQTDARRATDFLHPGWAAELRASTGPKSKLYGFYSDKDKLAFDAVQTAAQAVYWTVNEFANRPITNELQPAGRGDCTGKAHIVRLRNLFVDIDPVRPKGSASTPEAHQAAIDLANKIKADLMAAGWPEPMVMDSGNGAYLFWAIDLAPALQTLVRAVIEALRKRYATAQLEIDVSSATHARIARVPGTENTKGDSPRFASVLYIPEQRVEMTQAQLEALVWADLPSTAPEPTIDYQATVEREKAWLDSHHVAYDVEDHGDYTILRIHPCPWRPDQDDGNAWLMIHPEQGVSAGCFHGKCAGKNLKSLRQKLGGIDQVTTPDGLQAEIDDPHYLGNLHRERFAHCGQPTSVVMGEDLTLWNDGVWQPASDKVIQPHVVATIKAEFDRAAKRSGLGAPRKVKSGIVRDTIAAIRSLSLLPDRLPPFWVGSAPFNWDAADIMPFRNCLLHIPSWLAGAQIDRIKPTPLYYNSYRLAFDYVPDAPEPRVYKQFLASLWDDSACHDLANEYGGYVCTSDMSFQKLLMALGATRGGKGSLAWLYAQMHGGEGHVASPRLQTLPTRFGLEPLLGKRLAICSDAHNLKGQTLDGVCEVLKMITGEDIVPVDRKGRGAIDTKLPTKFVILSNHKLAIPDTSDALQARQLFLRFDRSFVGREDRTLKDKLRPELPAIANLFLAGLRRLYEQGRFTEPAASRELAQQIRHIGNPILGFVESECVISDNLATPTTTLYDAWQRWADDTDVEPMSRTSFGEQLMATYRTISKTQNVGGRKVAGKAKRPFCFTGIGLRASA